MTHETAKLVVAVAAVLVALLSVWYAHKANGKADAANKLAKRSLELTYRQGIHENPNSRLQIQKVEYFDASSSKDQWSVDTIIGVRMEGSLTNLTDQELLVTARPLSGYHNEVYRQNVIEVEGKTRTVISPNHTLPLIWENRQKLEYWQKLLVALTSDRDVKFLPEEWLDTFKGIVGETGAAEDLVKKAGFEVITETRAKKRVATHWTLIPQQSAVRQVGVAGQLVLEDSTQHGTVDDTVAKYRWEPEHGLARLFIPQITHLHGRKE